MSPEEEHREEIKWILQKIKKELLHVSSDNLVDFNAPRLMAGDIHSPSLDELHKHFKDFERAAIIRMVERYDGSGSDIYAYPLDAGVGVTGYKFIVDRDKFIKLYERYFKPAPVAGGTSFNFENEKRDIATIDSVEDHTVVADKWFNIKQILDALFKLLSPLDLNDTQAVTLYGQFLPREQSNLFKSVILDMFKAGVIGDPARTMRPVVINSNLATRVLKGEDIPIKTAKFKDYRKKVSDLVAWIETDRARFLKLNNNIVINGNENRAAITEANESVPQEAEDEEDDCFSYDGGISSPYENTDLELFILKKILLQHKQRDGKGFNAKELSFNNDSLADICRPIQLMIEDKILYLSANTFPERSSHDKDDGIMDKRGFINRKLVEQWDKNPSAIDAMVCGVNFDTDVQDEVKLKGRLDIAVEEFMNDKIQNTDGFAYGMDKSTLSEMLNRNNKERDEEKKKWIDEHYGSDGLSYPYAKQREIIIGELAKVNGDEVVMPLNGFRDQGVDVLKTLLALEKENMLRIKELQSNAMFDNDGNFIGLWTTKDNPVVRMHILKNQRISIDAAAMHISAFKGKLPVFDDENGDIIINGRKCHIAGVGDLQHHTCKELLSIRGKYKLGDWLSQTTLQDLYEPFGVVAEEATAGSVAELFKSERWLKDAVRAINIKTNKIYSIALFKYQSSQARVEMENFNS